MDVENFTIMANANLKILPNESPVVDKNVDDVGDDQSSSSSSCDCGDCGGQGDVYDGGFGDLEV